jgi:nitroimidazol reductase NimA-like FMN-containing flavoprotein (pyridoxamine 5'-phosphate oxidase superfamily)
MNREERESFLAGRHVGVICIEEPGRAPLAAPVWYDFSPEIGVWVLTEKSSRKGVLLEQTDRYSLVAQSEELPYKYVSVEGPIREVRRADKEKDSRPMARRYFGRALGDAYVDDESADDSYVYVMQPERWLTVDYAKLRGPLGASSRPE